MTDPLYARFHPSARGVFVRFVHEVDAFVQGYERMAGDVAGQIAAWVGIAALSGVVLIVAVAILVSTWRWAAGRVALGSRLPRAEVRR